MEDNYPKAYKEVIEILKYVPEESVNKIPQIMIDTFKTKMDEKHYFNVDINKNFEEQEILQETKAIMANKIFSEIIGLHHIKKKELKQRKNMIDKKMKKKKELNTILMIYFIK